VRTMPLVPMATAILVTYSSCSLGQSSENDYELAIGLVAYTEPSIYAGGGDNEGLLTYVEWEWQNWFFRDYSLGSYLAGGENWYLSAAISFDAFGDVDRGGSPELKDMKELGDIYTAGLGVGWLGSVGYLELNYRQDISDNHKGGSAVLRYGYPLNVRQWSVDPQISLTCVSSQVARYYVGVKATEAKAGRPAYRPGRACQYQAGVHLSRLYGNAHRVVLGVAHRGFSSDIDDSPIVDRNPVWSVSAGYLYEF